MSANHTRSEVLAALGQVIAKLRDDREEMHAEGKVNVKLNARIECLQDAYKCVMEHVPA